MIDGAAKAEEACNKIHDVWYNAIFNVSDSETDQYTKPNGYFVSDFNDALSNLFADEAFQAELTAITENQTTCIALMQNLTNPPEEYEAAYDALKEYYDNYLEMTNMALNPLGSLNSFTEDFNEIDTATVKSYEKMLVYLK